MAEKITNIKERILYFIEYKNQIFNYAPPKSKVSYLMNALCPKS